MKIITVAAVMALTSPSAFDIDPMLVGDYAQLSSKQKIVVIADFIHNANPNLDQSSEAPEAAANILMCMNTIVSIPRAKGEQAYKALAWCAWRGGYLE